MQDTLSTLKFPKGYAYAADGKGNNIETQGAQLVVAGEAGNVICHLDKASTLKALDQAFKRFNADEKTSTGAHATFAAVTSGEAASELIQFSVAPNFVPNLCTVAAKKSGGPKK